MLDPGTPSSLYNLGVTGTAAKAKFLRSGELARQAGVSADTLRHYERLGLLPAPPRSANGYRSYPPDALDRVRLIRSALSLGFTLAELGRILKVRDKGGAPCREVKSLAEEKLAEIETRLRDLAKVRDQLQGLLREWSASLHKTAATERAGLLESLAEANPDRQKRRSPLTPPSPGRRRKEPR